MEARELLREVESRGVALAGVRGQLRVRPLDALTPALIEGLRQHKAAILEALEGRDNPVTVTGLEQTRHRDGSTISDTAEVLALARAHFGEIAPEHRQEAPYAPPEPGRDPLAHKHTEKALWFSRSRARELERRRRHGLPSYIRMVDGGGDAA